MRVVNLWRSLPTRFVLGCALSFGCGMAVMLLITSGTDVSTAPSRTSPMVVSVREADHTVPRPTGKPPGLMSLIDSYASGESDIALANLLCAQGLPGAEQLDVRNQLETLNNLAAHVRAETERHMYRFHATPEEFSSSEPYFRMLMLIVVLQEDFGVHYNEERIDDPDYRDSRDLFIHGMTATSNDEAARSSGGTCVSMPVLYTAIGRRLGYPLSLVLAKGHVFCRWDGQEHANPAWRERLNIEGTNHGLNTFEDDHYRQWPIALTEADMAAGWYLRSLTPAEELAEFLMNRGHCLLDNGRIPEAQGAYAMAHRLAPACPSGLRFLIEAVNRELAVMDLIDDSRSDQLSDSQSSR
jgi:hypothetical protein